MRLLCLLLVALSVKPAAAAAPDEPRWYLEILGASLFRPNQGLQLPKLLYVLPAARDVSVSFGGAFGRTNERGLDFTQNGASGKIGVSELFIPELAVWFWPHVEGEMDFYAAPVLYVSRAFSATPSTDGQYESGSAWELGARLELGHLFLFLLSFKAAWRHVDTPGGSFVRSADDSLFCPGFLCPPDETVTYSAIRASYWYGAVEIKLGGFLD